MNKQNYKMITGAINKVGSLKLAAEMLEVSAPFLSDLRKGRRRVTPEMARKLEEAFGINGKQLLKNQAVDEYEETEL